MLPLADIHPSPINPRKRFDEEAITELAASIAEHGLLQPITVAPWTDGYVIVAGERRWRACSQLQLASVPCIIRPVGTDKEHLELALVENLQRTDIDPIEEAAGYRALMDLGLKQREIAERVHRQQPAVAKAIGLLDLPFDVQELISQGKLTPSHGVWLQSLSAFPEVCSLAAAHAVRAQTTVRDMDRTLNRDYYGIGHEIVKKGLAVELPSPHAADDTFNVRDTCMHGACPHKAYRGRLLCLKPDHYKELKQAAATARAKETRAAKANLEQGEQVSARAVDRIPHVVLTDWGPPPGCTTDCEHRKTVRQGDRKIEMCFKPEHFKELTAAAQEAEKRRRTAKAEELLAEATEMVASLSCPAEVNAVLCLAASMRLSSTSICKAADLLSLPWPLEPAAEVWRNWSREDLRKALKTLQPQQMLNLMALAILVSSATIYASNGDPYNVDTTLLEFLGRTKWDADDPEEPDDDGFRALAAAAEGTTP